MPAIGVSEILIILVVFGLISAVVLGWIAVFMRGFTRH